jgi:D-serine deaminase-like pyridoxal phosphate-dependent protein
MTVVPLLPETYRVDAADRIVTPALLIYPQIVESNINATIRMAGGDPNRWRPHLKTSKIPAVFRMLMDAGVNNFKCSTTLELLTACQAGAADVLLAFPVVGANALRVIDLARQFPETRISVLVESAAQVQSWKGQNIGLFIDINSGMNRTGVDQNGFGEIGALAKMAGKQFGGLHYYDGHMAGAAVEERESRTHAGYDRVMELVENLGRDGVEVSEVITSGTPAAPYAFSYRRFSGGQFVHRISPGTVVYNDLTSLEQLPGFGYQPAALVLTTVVSHPTADTVTCDAGHKSVSADAGVPTCAVVGHEDMRPLKPSEEHLPIQCQSSSQCAAIGDKLYLLPRHVCPTVNNFDQAIFISHGGIIGTEAVAARGHEALVLAV